MAAKAKSGSEWIAAARQTSAAIVGEAKPYSPLLLLWMDSATGAVLGAEPRHPDEGLAHAADHLRDVMAAPMSGEPRMPTRIRTASGALAEALALELPRTHPEIEIVVAATPETDALLDTMEGDESLDDTMNPAGLGSSDDDEISDDDDTEALLEAMAVLQFTAADGELDLDAVQAITDALLARFRASTQAKAFDHPTKGASLLLQFAATHQGRTLNVLDDRDLEELLFDIVPAKLSAGPDAARELIETARAFFVWLKAEVSFPAADDLIELLGEDAIDELEEHMRDDSNFGPAKTMVMAAMDAGVDLSNADAMRRFMEGRLPTGPDKLLQDPLYDPYSYDFGGMGAPAPPPLTQEQKRERNRKRKKDRKSARKARKKNR